MQACTTKNGKYYHILHLAQMLSANFSTKFSKKASSVTSETSSIRSSAALVLKFRVAKRPAPIVIAPRLPSPQVDQGLSGWDEPPSANVFYVPNIYLQPPSPHGLGPKLIYEGYEMYVAQARPSFPCQWNGCKADISTYSSDFAAHLDSAHLSLPNNANTRTKCLWRNCGRTFVSDNAQKTRHKLKLHIKANHVRQKLIFCDHCDDVILECDYAGHLTSEHPEMDGN
ncbi:hypothetical protein CVT26_015617 [Gymnopilus dilepis]|uniref:Uncharacterized protein n=1 Tax=Gymnopilus dilepis TaxID=231916 RepID=A0A409YDD0_9AGAR|nr:hypothetical protein CVT26_015617 [Gymnopilus dilepis]